MLFVVVGDFPVGDRRFVTGGYQLGLLRLIFARQQLQMSMLPHRLGPGQTLTEAFIFVQALFPGALVQHLGIDGTIETALAIGLALDVRHRHQNIRIIDNVPLVEFDVADRGQDFLGILVRRLGGYIVAGGEQAEYQQR